MNFFLSNNSHLSYKLSFSFLPLYSHFLYCVQFSTIRTKAFEWFICHIDSNILPFFKQDLAFHKVPENNGMQF